MQVILFPGAQKYEPKFHGLYFLNMSDNLYDFGYPTITSVSLWHFVIEGLQSLHVIGALKNCRIFNMFLAHAAAHPFNG